MDLKKITSGKIALDPKSIVGFVVVKNEALRLPYFLSYYRNLGVDQFIFIDNGSSDETVEILSNFEHVHVFSTGDKYGEHWSWIEHLLSVYALNRWCLVIDADELLVYPHCSTIKLHKLCEFFTLEGSRAMHCMLLDMYSNIPIERVNYKNSQDPLTVAPWFDPNTHHKMRSRYYGGMRERVFGITPCVTKYPLHRIESKGFPGRGMHDTLARPIANIQGALLHFKYFQDFYGKVSDGAQNNQYWNDSLEYKAYSKVLELFPDLNLWCPESTRLSDYNQLTQLGIMRTSVEFEEYAKSLKLKHKK